MLLWLLERYARSAATSERAGVKKKFDQQGDIVFAQHEHSVNKEIARRSESDLLTHSNLAQCSRAYIHKCARENLLLSVEASQKRIVNPPIAEQPRTTYTMCEHTSSHKKRKLQLQSGRQLAADCLHFARAKKGVISKSWCKLLSLFTLLLLGGVQELVHFDLSACFPDSRTCPHPVDTREEEGALPVAARLLQANQPPELRHGLNLS